MTKADRLSAKKLTVELEKTKVQMDIKKIIVETHLRFESVVRSLPLQDQKELVQLIIREISVKHFARKRTKWFAKTGSLRRKDELNGFWCTSHFSQVT